MFGLLRANHDSISPRVVQYFRQTLIKPVDGLVDILRILANRSPIYAATNPDQECGIIWVDFTIEVLE